MASASATPATRISPICAPCQTSEPRYRGFGAAVYARRTMQQLFLTAVLVRDYDEAIAFYVGKLGFEVRLDNPITAERRWVVLAPAGGGQGCILLAKAETEAQAQRIGDQTGGRVFLFLDT